MNKNYLNRNLILSCLVLLLVLCTVRLKAQNVSLTTGTYSENFNSLAITGTSSTMPTGWAFVETGSNLNTTYSAGNGSSTSGDTYSFGTTSASDRSLGGQRSGTLIPVIGSGYTNNSSGAINTITITYTGEQWRLGATGRNDKLQFEYSLNATSLNTGTYVPFTSLDFTAPISTGTAGALDGNAAANRTTIVSTITGLNIAVGGTVWIRWTDLDATGADDGLGVDDFSLSFTNSAVVPPTITCPSNIVTTTAAGTCGAVVNYTAPTVSPSGTAVLTCGLASGSTFPSGVTTVCYAVSGNPGITCSFTVTVNDNQAPVAVCQNVTLQLNSSGTATLTPAQVNNGSTDNCGITGMSLSKTTFTCADIAGGPSTNCPIDANYNDNATNANSGQNGQSFTILSSGYLEKLDVLTAGTCQFNLRTYVSENLVDAFTGTVLGTTNSVTVGGTPVWTTFTFATPIPVVAGQKYFFEFLGSGVAYHHIPGTYAGGAAVSPTNPATTRDIPFKAYVCSSANQVTLTVTDAAGNSSTCVANITVQDVTPPVAICQNASVNLNASGTASITAAQINNGSTDNCGIASVTVSPTTFNCTNLSSGALPSDLIISEYIEGLSNNKSIEIYNGTSTAINLGSGGYQLRVYANGSATATNTITLTGIVASGDVFIVSNPSANATILAQTDLTSGLLTFNGNDAVALTKNLSPTTFVDIFGSIGNDPGTAWTNGSFSTVDKTLRRLNTVTSGITANPASSFPQLGTQWLQFNTDDATGLGAHTSAAPSGTPVTLTVTDVNGNVSTCTASVFVNDVTPPSISCPGPQSLSVGAGCAVALPNYTASATASDNCGTPTITQSPSAGTSLGSGTTVVTLTATDGAGLTSSCTFNVVVADNVPPVAVCQNATITLNSSGTAVLAASQINNGSSDNCAITSMTVNPNSFTCANVGTPVTVTLTVFDANGNSNSCTATVTVTDITAPTAVCQPATVQLGASGTGTLLASQVNNGSTDNCGIASMTVTPNTFNCSNITSSVVPADLFISEYIEGLSNNKSIEIYNGTGSPVNLGTGGYQLRVYANGASTAGSTITLTGILAAGDVFVVSHSSANATILAQTDLTSGALTFNGNDAVALTKNLSPTTFVDIFGSIGNDPGSAWTNGSFSTVDKTLRRIGSVTQGITTNPVASFPQLGTQWVQFNTDDAAGLGVHSIATGTPVTLTVTDNSGLTSTCTTTVSVVDNIFPTAVCKPVTLPLNASGTATLTAAQVDNGSSDNCGIASMTVTPNTFNCSNIGTPVNVTLSVTDGSGHTSTCTAVVTVVDNTAPVANCQNVTVILNASGTGSITAAQVNNNSTDNCGIANMSVSPNTFNCSSIGGTTVPTDLLISEYIEGSSNNKSIEIFNGTGSTVNLTTGGYQLRVYANGSSTPTSTISLTGSIAAGDVFVISHSSANATILAQSDQTSGSVSFNGNDAVALTKNGATATPVDIFGSIGTDPGTAWTSGSFTTLDRTLRRLNTISQGITANPSASFPQLGTQWVQFSTDDASGLGAHALASGTGSGTVPVVLTVTDNSGNTSTCNATVTVVDNIPPAVICQNQTVTLNASGTASITAAQINNGSTDACGIATVTVSPSSFNCSNIGPNTVTLTVTDNNGNSATCTSIVTIADNTAPLANCQNVTVVLDASGNGSVTAAQVNNGSTDNCTITGMTVSPSTFNCTNVGTGIIPTDLFISEYVEGTSNNKSIEIYNGTNSPINLGSGYQLRVYSNGSSTPVSINLTGTVATGDVYIVSHTSASASILAVTDQTSGSLSFNGNDAVVLYNNTTATTIDIIGRIGEDPGTAWISGANQTLDRTLRRKASILSGITTNPSSGFPTLGTEWDVYATDNIANLGSHSVTTGVNVVTLTVTDASGNSSTCLSSVTVVDNTPPQLGLPASNSTVACDGSGNTAALNAWLGSHGGATAADACGVSWSNNFVSLTPSCGATGSATVTFTAADPSGNAVSSTATFTISDNTPPAVTAASNSTVQCDGAGNTAALNAWLSSHGGATASDVCSGVSWSDNYTGLSDLCGATGSATVTFIATDDCGNSASTTATFTINDNTPPVISCPGNISVNTDANQCGAVVNFTASASDVCSGTVPVNASSLPGSFFPTGITTVVLTSTDDCGNTSSCTFTVTVTDNQLPTISCAGNMSVSNSPGLCGAVVNYNAPAASDNCNYTVTQTSGFASGASFPIGTTVNTFVVSDASGNSATCSFSVTVNDTEAPSLVSGSVCPGNFAGCNPVSWTAPLFQDNCPGLQISSTHTPGTNFPVGTTPVTYTATDLTGNTTTCSFNVTVLDTSAAASSISSNRDYNNICNGGDVTLTVNGGHLGEVAPGVPAQWKWYSGSCGGTFVGSGTSVTVAPSVTTTYFVRAEGGCITTACVQITIVVSNAPPATIPIFTNLPTYGAPGVTDTIAVAPVPGATFYRWFTINGHINSVIFNSQPAGPVETSIPSVMATFVLPQQNYQIRVIAGNACGRTNQANSHVRGTVEAPGAISGATIVCPGNVKTYTIPAVSGNNSPSSYQWTLTPATAGTLVVAANGLSATVTYAAGFTNAVLCVNGVSNFGLAGPQTCITVSNSAPVPGAITGPATPCSGSSQTYSISAVAGASSYNWSSTTGTIVTVAPNGLSATVQFPAGAFSGNICVTASSTCGTSSPSCLAVTNGVPGNPGNISGPTGGVCGASNVNYNLGTSNGNAYLWSVTAGMSINGAANNNSVAVNFLPGFTSGTVSVLVTYSCGSVTKTLNVSGAPATPQVTPSDACPNTANTYFVTNIEASTTYSWSTTGNVLDSYCSNGACTQYYLELGSGGGSFTVTASNNCGSTSFTSTSNCRMATGTTELLVYPNPTSGILTVEFNSSNESSSDITVTDLSGRVILTRVVKTTPGTNQHELDLGFVNSGIYMLYLKTSDGSINVRKITIE